MYMYKKQSYSSKKEKAICPVCGKEFIKKTHNQKYCSVRCQKEKYDIEKKEWWRKFGIEVAGQNNKK